MSHRCYPYLFSAFLKNTAFCDMWLILQMRNKTHVNKKFMQIVHLFDK